MLVAAVEHNTGVVLGQVEFGSRSNEIPAVRELSSHLDLAGRIVILDAMHAQHETARCLLGHRADYVLSAVKDLVSGFVLGPGAVSQSVAAIQERARFQLRLVSTCAPGRAPTARRSFLPRAFVAWFAPGMKDCGWRREAACTTS